MNPKLWFKPRMVVRIFLEGGAHMDIPCRNYTFHHQTNGGAVTSYEFDGIPLDKRLITVDIRKIIAVQRVK